MGDAMGHEIGLVLIAKDEENVIGRCLDSALPLISECLVVDTGSKDGTVEVIDDWADRCCPQTTICFEDWTDFGDIRTKALHQAGIACTSEWMLLLDADMTVEFHADLLKWLASDPDPSVDAWMVTVQEGDLTYQLPLLVRRDRDWQYHGKVHEYLDTSTFNRRSLLGLTVVHHSDGSRQAEKAALDIDILLPEVLEGDDRATFYSAWAHWSLGHMDEARDLFIKRSKMGGFEEEAWYAEYLAAKISSDIAGLLHAWRRRPWRHEPLTAAAQILAADTNSDILFQSKCIN